MPVYVIFFAIIAADLDLLALKTYLWVALILVSVRIFAIFVGSLLATKVAKAPVEIRKNAWLGFVAQAGVTLGLAKVLVEGNLGTFGQNVAVIATAMVTINLLIGPVLFKAALANVGETKAERDEMAEIKSNLEESKPDLTGIGKSELNEIITKAESGDEASIDRLEELGLIKR